MSILSRQFVSRTMVRAVVADLDGTLAHTWPVHARCLRRAAVAVGLPAPSAARLAAAQRPTDLDTLAALVGADHLDAAFAIYAHEFCTEITREPASPADGVTETFARLRDAGMRLGVCTGRSRDGAEAVLHHCGLVVDELVAREDAARPKPAPDGLLTVLQRLGVGPDAAIYIGDTEADLRQGEAAHVRTMLLGATRRPGAVTLQRIDDIFDHLNP